MTVPPSILTIDTTGVPFLVAVQKAGHAEPRVVGGTWTTFNGNLKNGTKAELMVLPLIIVHTDDYPADSTTVAAIRALLADATPRYFNGLVFNNAYADILCSGEITDEMEVGGPNWVANLTLYEVENVGTSL